MSKKARGRVGFFLLDYTLMRTGNSFFFFFFVALSEYVKLSLMNLTYISCSTAASQYSLSLNNVLLCWIIFPYGKMRLYFSSCSLTLTVAISILVWKGKLRNQSSWGTGVSLKFCKDWRCNNNVGKSNADSIAMIKTQYIWEIYVEKEDRLCKSEDLNVECQQEMWWRI